MLMVREQKGHLKSTMDLRQQQPTWIRVPTKRLVTLLGSLQNFCRDQPAALPKATLSSLRTLPVSFMSEHDTSRREMH